MTTAADFDEFVRDRSARLLRVAYLFTRDHALAEDLLQTTYARCWPSWQRIEGDPEPYVRRALVNTYNSWWRRKWNGELPSDDVPDAPDAAAPQEDVDARDEVWRAVRKLPRQQQIVIVLRYFEDLTEAQIADVMRISPGAVKSYASKALTRLRRDPTLSGLPMLDVEPTPDASRRVAGVHERIRHAQRVRLVTVGTAIMVILTLTAAFVVGLSIRHRPVPHPVRPSPSPSGSPLAFGSDGSYFDGKHIVAQLPPTKKGQAVSRLRWTPRPDHLAQIFFVCVRQQAPDLTAEMWIGEELAATADCDQDAQPIPADWWRSWDFQAIDLEPGSRPVTFEIRLRDPAGPATKPTDGSVAMIVVERSTMAEYVFPTPPDQLPVIERPKTERRYRFEQGKPLTATMKLPARFIMSGRSQGPGILHIDADGDEVGTLAWWDWDGQSRTQCHSGSGRAIDADRTVTITVRPENIQGDWFMDVIVPEVQSCP